MASEDALSGLAEDVAAALVLFARRRRAALVEAASPVAAPAAARGPKVGPSQQLALDALRKAGPNGLTSAEVATETEKNETNTPRMLKGLAARGLVRSTDTTPAVWTLVLPEPG